MFSIIITLQLTMFMSMSSLQYTIFSCQEYICSAVKLRQLLQYLPKHALQSSSHFTILKDQQSGLDMERWLTPLRTSTYERPFTQEGNYLVLSAHVSGIGSSAVYFSGVVTILNNKESNNTYLSASTSTFQVAVFVVGNLFWTRYSY